MDSVFKKNTENDMVISNRAGHEKENKNELKKNKRKLSIFENIPIFG